ncbi:MAG: NUDIX hydrolase [Candidatus Magasanikbacteria bacterium]|nr:NUDIX hydrolase [Candidatus Magasanikbacteria bacterium]
MPRYDKNHKLTYGTLKKVYSGIIFEIDQRSVVFPDGTKKTFEYCSRNDSVVIMPFDKKGRLLLIREFRHRHKREVLFLPAGRRDKKNESPLKAAHRELREETGYDAKTWKLFHTKFPTENLLWDARVFLAKDLYPAPLVGDEDFPIKLVPTSIKKAAQLASDGKIENEFLAYNIIRLGYLMRMGKLKW